MYIYMLLLLWSKASTRGEKVFLFLFQFFIFYFLPLIVSFEKGYLILSKHHQSIYGYIVYSTISFPIGFS